jgi:hypothetical protein
MTRYRIDSESDWSAQVSRLRSAPSPVLVNCLKVIRDQALVFLSGSGWQGVEAIQRDLELGIEGNERIKARAEAEDDKYLDAGMEVEDVPAGDPVHDHVHDLFVRARALAALAFAVETGTEQEALRGAVLEAAYELSIALGEQKAALRQELDAVCREAF